jgi:hypothetical protein
MPEIRKLRRNRGHRAIVTNRNKPMAILSNPGQIDEHASFKKRLASLAASGIVTLPKRKPSFKRCQRVRIKGEPVSETIIKERGSFLQPRGIYEI